MALEGHKVLEREIRMSGGFPKLLDPTDLCAFEVLDLWTGWRDGWWDVLLSFSPPEIWDIAR